MFQTHPVLSMFQLPDSATNLAVLISVAPNGAPALRAHIGLLAIILLVIVLVAVATLVLVAALLNRRRRIEQARRRTHTQRTPDPWVTAGRRLDPDDASGGPPPGRRHS
jgi:heme/copper-type cytochrome/quinol oxidase subunit 2